MINKSYFKTLTTSVLVTLLSLGLMTNAQSNSKRLISPVADWTGGAVTCKLVQLIAEQELGYKIKRITMPSGTPVLEALSAGDMDYACENWPSYDPVKDKFFTKWGGDGSISYLGETGIVGTSGYFVPRYFVDEVANDLSTYEQLNKYKEHFTTIESGGKGRLIACPTPAWECEDQARLDGLGVDFVAVELGTETAAWAEAQAAYARHEPFLLYAWTPHWIHAALDLVQIGLPDYNGGKDWPASGWDTDITFNYGNPESMSQHGDIAYLLGNMHLSNVEQSAMVMEIDLDGRDMDEVVQEWIDANKEIWKHWIL